MRYRAVLKWIVIITLLINSTGDLAGPLKINNIQSVGSKLNLGDYNTKGVNDVIVIYKGKNPIGEKLFYGDAFSASRAILTGNQLESMLLNDDIILIEKNQVAHTTLLNTNAQMGMSKLLEEIEYNNLDHSIAILDTGIDFSHTAFNNRIRASYNVFNANATPAVDYNGHGSHVAGIAAGDYSSEKTMFTKRGQLEINPGEMEVIYVWDQELPFAEMNVTLDWGVPGVNSGSEMGVVLLDTDYYLACTGCQIQSEDGFIQTQFNEISEGKYYLAIINTDTIIDTEYELSVTTDNPSTYRGMAYRSDIVPVKVMNDEGTGMISDILSGISWVLQNRDKYNISVINLSLGLFENSLSMDLAMKELTANGIIPVVSAGNGGDDGIFSPASSPEVITVGAVTRSNDLASYSSIGAGEIIKPDVLAPGGESILRLDRPVEMGDILSMDSNYVGYNLSKDSILGMSGTSMSAPHVAGLAMVLMSEYHARYNWAWNNNSVYTIKQAILSGTYEIANLSTKAVELSRDSKDNREGWGMIDSMSAYKSLFTQCPLGVQELVFEFENPYLSNVFSWRLEVTETPLLINLSNTVGADIDLLLVDAERSDRGDLIIEQSSTNAKSLNEEIVITESGSYIIMVRMVYSDNTRDLVHLNINIADYHPFIEFLSPLDQMVVGADNITIDYSSATNYAELFIDDISQGRTVSGTTISGIGEGWHSLELREYNPHNDEDASAMIDIYHDLTDPEIIMNNLPIIITDTSVITFNATDNYSLNSAYLRIDGTIQGAINLNGLAMDNIELSLNPDHIPFGQHYVELILVDLSGRQSNYSRYVSFEHGLYIENNPDIVHEYGEDLIIFVHAGSVILSNLGLELLIHGTTYTYDWNGGPTSINFTDSLELGEYKYSIIVHNEQDSIWINSTLNVRDTIKPVLSYEIRDVYDSNKIVEICIEVIDELPYLLYYNYGNVDILIQDMENQKLFCNPMDDYHGITGDLHLVIEDTSGNTNKYYSEIHWEDLTEPELYGPAEISYQGGEAFYEWFWIENETKSVRIELDQNIQVPDMVSQSYSITGSDLAKLSNGQHKLSIAVTDVADHRVSIEVSILVEIEITDGTDGGFIIISPIMSFVGIIIYSLKSKRYHNG